VLRITAKVSSRLIDSSHISPKFRVLWYHILIKERLWVGGFGEDFSFFLEEAAASCFLRFFLLFTVYDKEAV